MYANIFKPDCSLCKTTKSDIPSAFSDAQIPKYGTYICESCTGMGERYQQILQQKPLKLALDIPSPSVTGFDTAPTTPVEDKPPAMKNPVHQAKQTRTKFENESTSLVGKRTSEALEGACNSCDDEEAILKYVKKETNYGVTSESQQVLQQSVPAKKIVVKSAMIQKKSDTKDKNSSSVIEVDNDTRESVSFLANNKVQSKDNLREFLKIRSCFKVHLDGEKLSLSYDDPLKDEHALDIQALKQVNTIIVNISVLFIDDEETKALKQIFDNLSAIFYIKLSCNTNFNQAKTSFRPNLTKLLTAVFSQPKNLEVLKIDWQLLGSGNQIVAFLTKTVFSETLRLSSLELNLPNTCLGAELLSSLVMSMGPFQSKLRRFTLITTVVSDTKAYQPGAVVYNLVMPRLISLTFKVHFNMFSPIKKLLTSSLPSMKALESLDIGLIDVAYLQNNEESLAKVFEAVQGLHTLKSLKATVCVDDQTNRPKGNGLNTITPYLINMKKLETLCLGGKVDVKK